MSEFKKGQRVRIELEGTVVSVHGNGRPGYLHWTDEDGRGASIYSDAPSVKVTLADPEDWPPQVGDIWEAEGREYYARQNMACGDEIMVGNFDRPNQDYYQRDLDDFKALNPVLVRRRNAHPAQPVCVERSEGR